MYGKCISYSPSINYRELISCFVDWNSIDMEKNTQNNNPIVELSEQLAVSILPICALLKKSGEYDLARQLFKSSTSVGANIAESQHAESKADFVHKLKIAAKEAREAEFWLLLVSKCHNELDIRSEKIILIRIQKLLSSILKTCSDKRMSKSANQHIKAS
jgi:four helix bundle protein